MTSVHEIIELDTRTTDGIDVRLLWQSAEERVSVTARDVHSGETVEVEVRDHERALAVFHHPYAYAAFHGVEPHAEAPGPSPPPRLAMWSVPPCCSKPPSSR